MYTIMFLYFVTEASSANRVSHCFRDELSMLPSQTFCLLPEGMAPETHPFSVGLGFISCFS